MTNVAFNKDAVYAFNAGSMFLQGTRGLIDSVHRSDETTFRNYKLLKKQDWDENEYPLLAAREDFLNYPKEGEMMKNNIGWQWGGDSAAANSIVPMFAPLMPSSDAWLWLSKQGENENLHALSYSECVRISVPDGMAEITRIHRDADTMRRVGFITEVMHKVITTGAKITLGMIDHRSEEASDALMLGLGGVYILERCQFMPSFANTAALYYGHRFTPIGDTVRKIAIDEWGTHIPQVRFFLEHELQFAERQASLRRIKPLLTKVLEEVTHNEVLWNARQFAIGGDKLCFTESMGADYSYYAGTEVAEHIGLDPNFKQVLKNPLPFMDNFLDLNRERKASMEQKGGNYQTVNAARSAVPEVFDLTGL